MFWRVPQDSLDGVRQGAHSVKIQGKRTKAFRASSIVKAEPAQEGCTTLNHPFRKLSVQRLAACLLTSLIPVSAVVITGMAGTASAQKAAVSPKAKHGETLFQTNCIGCHNKQPGDTTPFGPPNLHGVFGSKPLLTPQEAVQTIKTGKGIMPSFDGKLTNGDISDIIAYLKTQ
jgi:cytochrome c2